MKTDCWKEKELLFFCGVERESSEAVTFVVTGENSGGRYPGCGRICREG
jgi:hypothetical protein